MNGIEKITARILADAQTEADAVKAEAEARCAQIRGEYDKKAQEEYWRLVRSGVADCEARVQRLGRTAEMEAKKNLLALKQELVSAAFDQAVEQVRAMPQEQYVEFLARLAAKASDSKGEELVMAPRDAGLGEAVAESANELLGGGKLRYDGATREMLGGVVLRDGDIEINCSIETLVAQYRYELASQVAEVLFG
ncbi:MAG: V-type ATP synthase subunit E [Candidatus Heteroscillospira sp.]|jgi:V/A-type H+-transporting ATPase subunit E